MDPKKQRIAVLICLVLFVAAFLVFELFSKSDSTEWDASSGSAVILSEILASNRTYPAPDGQLLDFIEIHNLSANAVDISGFMLSDDLNSIGYTFPEDTVLPPYGYAVCWCDPHSDSDQYAKFGISRDGGETIYLYNHANVLVDEKKVPAVPANTAIIHTDTSSWTETPYATPGFANTQEGYSQWLSTMTGGDLQITITEVMTDNSCVTATAGATPYDWVELTNTGSKTADLKNAYFSNDPSDPLKWQLPDLTLAPGESAVVYCAGGKGSLQDAPFALSKSGCTLILTSNLGNTLSEISCPALLPDHSWSQTADGSYVSTDRPTPGFPNTEAGFAAWTASVGAGHADVVISEIMAANRSTVLSAAGRFCDWVELTNLGTAAVTLDGAYLSDDPGDRGKWSISKLTLAPGESAVIPCAGDLAVEGEANFGLSGSGGTVILSGSAGNIISQVTYPRLDDDRVWARQEDGTYLLTDTPTPGYPNTDEGYLAYRNTQNPLGALAITEVMSTNDRYLMQSDGRYYDWVELTNVSDTAIDLSDFYLSDDGENPTGFQLPKRTLKPGQQIVVICSANDTLVGNHIQAPFTLGADEAWVYVTDSAGNFSDSLRVFGVPEGCSMGRSETENGIFYFAQPTPGRPNGTGTALISQIPTTLTAPGVYDGVSSLRVTLEGTGNLHYTTDGSVPTAEDPLYTGPIPLNTTTVLRVISLEEGKLPSKVLTAGYILNENHTLPVLSLSADPEELTALLAQTPPMDAEISCHLSLFEQESSFGLDCGLELMGTGTAYPEKKSLKVNFRSRYGANVLGYPLFGTDGPQIFDALCLQAGSEQGLTLFRDELFTELCLQLTDSVPAQHYKFCILYINGSYYGIYSLQEDISQMLYSQQMAVAELDVTMVEDPGLWTSDLTALAQYCGEQDMSVQSNFDYLTARMDIDSLIDWMILQGYCCNDAVADDLRYFRTPETGNRWQLGFFDADGGFTDRIGFASVFAEDLPYNYLCFTRAIGENPAARQQFLSRLAQALDGVLSDDNVLSLIDSFATLLAPEIDRERTRWGGDAVTWQADVDRLKTYLTRYDHTDLLLQSLREQIGLTDEEAAALLKG